MMNINKIEEKSLYALIILLLNKISMKRKINLIILFVLMLISSFAEIFSLTLVMPFLKIISNPDSVWQFEFVQNLNQIFGFKSPKELIIPITFLFIILFASKNTTLQPRAFFNLFFQIHL